MRTFEITLAIAVPAAASLPAQQPGAAIPMKDFASSADVAALIAQVKSEHKEGQPLLSKPILTLPPINANLEYRTAVAPAAVHETEAGIFYAIDGAGTTVTGGQLTGKNGSTRRILPAQASGTASRGGSPKAVSLLCRKECRTGSAGSTEHSS